MSNDPIVRLDRLERSHVRMKRLAAALAVLLATACAVAMNVEEEAADAASSRIAAAKEVLALFDAQESGGRGPSTEERSTWSLHLLHAELEGGSRPAVDAYRDHLDRMESVAEDIRLLASEGRRSAIDAAKAEYRAAEANFWWERERGR